MTSVGVSPRSWALRGPLVALTLTLVVGCVAEVGGSVVRPEPTAARRDPEPAGRAALREWDAERAAAWRTGDLERLGALYLDRARAGRRDLAMLRAWKARGARLETLTTQVLAVDPVQVGARRVVLRVTDRVREVRVGTQRLGGDHPTTRRIELVLRGGHWRVARVRTLSPRGPS